MGEEYDKERSATLIKEAQEIIGHLKAETDGIKRQMERVLDGGEEETSDTPEGEKAAGDEIILEKAHPAKSRWRFWRLVGSCEE